MSAPPSMTYEDKTLWLVTPLEERLQPWKFPPPPSTKHTTLAEDMTSPYVRGEATKQMLVDLMKPGDQLYYWNGPWPNRGGSRGLAVVRNGRVIDTYVFA